MVSKCDSPCVGVEQRQRFDAATGGDGGQEQRDHGQQNQHWSAKPDHDAHTVRAHWGIEKLHALGAGRCISLGRLPYPCRRSRAKLCRPAKNCSQPAEKGEDLETRDRRKTFEGRLERNYLTKVFGLAI